MSSDQQRLQALVAKVRVILDDRSIILTADVDPYMGKWLIRAQQGVRALQFTVAPETSHESLVEAIERWAVKLAG